MLGFGSRPLGRGTWRARTGLVAAVVWPLAANGCASPPGPARDPDAIPLPGQNVTLYYDPGSEPCAGTLAYLDATAAAIGSYLNLAIKTPIPYYYTQNLFACPSEQDLGCTILYDNGDVTCWSSQPATTHELVHAVQFQTGNDAPSFLLEGQAVSLGQLWELGVGDQGATDSALLSTNQIAATDYPLAGDFVSYLLTRFGPAPFERTIASVRLNDSVDAIESAFAQQYDGETMSQLRADRAASPQTFYANRIDVGECMAVPPDNRLGQPGTVSETVDCASNAVGTFAGQATRDVPFDIASEGLYRLEVTPAAGGFPSLETCGGGRVLDQLQPDSVVVGYLHPGRYVFVLTAPSADSPSTFSIGVEPVALAASPPCASVPPIQVPAGTKRIYLFSMDDRSIEVPFVLGGAQTTLVAEGLDNLSSAQLCAGGCGLDCQPSSPFVALPPVPADATFSLQATLVGQPDLIAQDLE